jgi:hypothetical protein
MHQAEPASHPRFEFSFVPTKVRRRLSSNGFRASRLECNGSVTAHDTAQHAPEAGGDAFCGTIRWRPSPAAPRVVLDAAGPRTPNVDAEAVEARDRRALSL